MGYTHYWRRGRLNASKWTTAIVDARKIMEHGRERQTLDRDDNDETHAVWFNGIGDNAHETFSLPLTTAEVQDFDFCKTARKPYDVYVTACLAVFAEAGLKISSDGETSDWTAGVELARDVLFRIVRNPLAPRTRKKPPALDGTLAAGLVEAAKLALLTMHNITSEEFQRGGDKDARETLERAVKAVEECR